METYLKKIELKPYLNSESEDFKCFRQFNVCSTIDCEDYICYKGDIGDYYSCYNPTEKIYKVENTSPELKIMSAKIIDTIEGISLEGQYLTGKKLTISGLIDFRMILYCLSYDKENTIIIDTKIPFGTFIIVPKDTCKNDIVRLSYAIEDISIIKLTDYRIFVNAAVMMVYEDEY